MTRGVCGRPADHSPAPWSFDGSAVLDAAGDEVCDLMSNRPFQAAPAVLAANGLLLAAAPSLADAGSDLARLVGDLLAEALRAEQRGELLPDWLDEIRPALTFARRAALAAYCPEVSRAQ